MAAASVRLEELGKGKAESKGKAKNNVKVAEGGAAAESDDAAVDVVSFLYPPFSSGIRVPMDSPADMLRTSFSAVGVKFRRRPAKPVAAAASSRGHVRGRFGILAIVVAAIAAEASCAQDNWAWGGMFTTCLLSSSSMGLPAPMLRFPALRVLPIAMAVHSLTPPAAQPHLAIAAILDLLYPSVGVRCGAVWKGLWAGLMFTLQLEAAWHAQLHATDGSLHSIFPTRAGLPSPLLPMIISLFVTLADIRADTLDPPPPLSASLSPTPKDPTSFLLHTTDPTSANDDGPSINTLAAHPRPLSVAVLGLLHAPLFLLTYQVCQHENDTLLYVLAVHFVHDVVAHTTRVYKTRPFFVRANETLVRAAATISTVYVVHYLAVRASTGEGDRQVPFIVSAVQSVPVLCAFIVSAVYFAEFNCLLSDRMSRKALHIGIGCLILTLQPDWPIVVVLGSGIMGTQVLTHLMGFKFRFARSAFDLGMFEYSLLMLITALAALPWSILAPSFFADPFAMIVGSNIKSPKWWGDKTVAGSLAALIATAICFSLFGAGLVLSIGAGVVVTLAEALGGAHDNLTIGCCCIAMHVLRRHLDPALA